MSEMLSRQLVCLLQSQCRRLLLRVQTALHSKGTSASVSFFLMLPDGLPLLRLLFFVLLKSTIAETLLLETNEILIIELSPTPFALSGSLLSRPSGSTVKIKVGRVELQLRVRPVSS